MPFISQTTVATGAPDLVIPNVPCASDVSAGDWVRMQGGVAVKAMADALANSNVMGLVESKNGVTSANVRVLGVSASLFSNLDETKEYYLSATAAGAMDSVPPTNSGEVILKVGQPFDSSRILVQKGTRLVRS